MTELQEFLETFVPRQEAADEALHNGDPEPRMQLWSHEDPVTVLGAFGVAASGWEGARGTFRWVASRFSKCEGFRLELIAAGVSGDLAYTVGFEHSTVSRDGGPMRPHRLRVTHVYRREDGEWKIVHRHGDLLEADRAPSTTQEKDGGMRGRVMGLAAAAIAAVAIGGVLSRKLTEGQRQVLRRAKRIHRS